MFLFVTGNEKNYILSSEQAFNKYSDMVWRLALSKTASRDNADDILQDVFMKYVHKNSKFYDEEHLKAWLLRVTINCANSFLRSPWEKKTGALDDNDFYTEMKEESQVYYEVLKLPQKYKTAIHLHYYEGYSVNEIASICKAKPATVKTWLFRGREILKQTLKGEDF